MGESRRKGDQEGGYKTIVNPNGTQSSPPETVRVASTSTLDSSHLSSWREISIARKGCHVKMAYNHDKEYCEETFGIVQEYLVHHVTYGLPSKD